MRRADGWHCRAVESKKGSWRYKGREQGRRRGCASLQIVGQGVPLKRCSAHYRLSAEKKTKKSTLSLRVQHWGWFGGARRLGPALLLVPCAASSKAASVLRYGGLPPQPHCGWIRPGARKPNQPAPGCCCGSWLAGCSRPGRSVLRRLGQLDELNVGDLGKHRQLLQRIEKQGCSSEAPSSRGARHGLCWAPLLERAVVWPSPPGPALPAALQAS